MRLTEIGRLSLDKARFQNSKTSTVFPPSPMPPVSDNFYALDLQQKVKETALFAEANYDLTERLTPIAGREEARGRN